MSERFLKEFVVRQRRRKARKHAAAESLIEDFIRSSSQVTAVDEKMSGLLTSYLREEGRSQSVTRPRRPVIPVESVDNLLQLYVTGETRAIKDD